MSGNSFTKKIIRVTFSKPGGLASSGSGANQLTLTGLRMSATVAFDGTNPQLDLRIYGMQPSQVDEVKDIRDKAIAMEAYARQSRNTEAERRACEIRLRAERKCGELLKELERSKGGRPSINSLQSEVSFKNTREKAGISDTQAHRWQKLADIPEEQFEATFARPEKPSTNGIIAAAKPQSQAEIEQRAMDQRASKQVA